MAGELLELTLDPPVPLRPREGGRLAQVTQQGSNGARMTWASGFSLSAAARAWQA